MYFWQLQREPQQTMQPENAGGGIHEVIPSDFKALRLFYTLPSASFTPLHSTAEVKRTRLKTVRHAPEKGIIAILDAPRNAERLLMRSFVRAPPPHEQERVWLLDTTFMNRKTIGEKTYAEFIAEHQLMELRRFVRFHRSYGYATKRIRHPLSILDGWTRGPIFPLGGNKEVLSAIGRGDILIHSY
jgi:hypothetical protein